MLALLLALAWAVPPDTLAGATLGAPFVKSDYTCDVSGCWVRASVAGIQGRRGVIPCNGKISAILWMSDDTSDQEVLTGWLISLMKPMSAAGWGSRMNDKKTSRDPGLGTVVSTTVDMLAPDGRSRQIIATSIAGASTVSMTASDDIICTEGLEL